MAVTYIAKIGELRIQKTKKKKYFQQDRNWETFDKNNLQVYRKYTGWSISVQISKYLCY